MEKVNHIVQVTIVIYVKSNLIPNPVFLHRIYETSSNMYQLALAWMMKN